MGGTRSKCLFCELAQPSPQDRAQFILERGEHCYVIINRYPYTTGHVMVVCNRHVERITDLTSEESAEMMSLVARCERAITGAYHPDGINVGANLGRSAGAGIVGHLHVHLVPRWTGDTNFMSSIGETRVVSEDLNDTFERLAAALEEDGRGS